MTAQQYTQGNWQTCRPDPNTGNVRIREGDLTVAFAVCADWGYEHGPDRITAKANARLIAAAPEMLDALHDAEQEIVELLEDLCDEPEEDTCAHRTLAKIRAAIAKARG